MAVDFPREVALKILYEVGEKGAYSNIAVNRHLEANELKDVDRAFITDLVYGTVKWKLTIDWIIEQFSSVKMKKISPWVLNILRLGVYQLMFMDKVPESAACNESVALAKKYGHLAATKFVNAILRNIVRRKSSLEYPDKSSSPGLYLSVKYSHPLWMVDSWLRRFGGDFTEQLLISNNEAPAFTVRHNRLKVSREQLADSLKASGLDVTEGKYMPEALIIKNPRSVSRLEEFKKGWFQVQDESSMLVGRILDPKEGELVIDVCSAPGGKATHVAELMGNRGRVLARDIHEHKIKLIEDAAHRLGLDIVKGELFDAGTIDGQYAEKADRVLVDAPCSGLGIIRRKPDIKWARTEEEMKGIEALQARILNASAKLVKPGGTLVYSTCTIRREENGDRVREFLRDNPDFEPADITPCLPAGLSQAEGEKGCIQLFPNIHRSDGFFVAKMVRTGGRDGR